MTRARRHEHIRNLRPYAPAHKAGANGATDKVTSVDELTPMQKGQARVDGESVVLLRKAGYGTEQAIKVVEKVKAETVTKVSAVFANIAKDIEVAGGVVH